LLGSFACAVGTIFENIFHVVGRIPRAPLLDRIEYLDESVCRPTFAFDAADSGGAAAFVDLRECFRRGEDFVKISDRAFVRIARVLAMNAGRIRDHRLELLANLWLWVGEQDGVAVALGHLATVSAGQFGRGSEQDIGFGKYFAAIELIEVVETASYFSG